MRLHIVVCDDVREHLACIEQLILEKARTAGQEVTVDAFPGAEALLSAMAENRFAADIAVLDIAMEGMDGISLAKRMNEALPRCQIVFLTAYSNYAMDAYEAEHVYLVLKDRMEEGLWPAIEKAARKLDAAMENGLAVKTARGVVLCAYSDILYLEHSGRKTNVVTAHRLIVANSTLAELRRSLPDRFYLCHQSFVVNLDYAVALEKDCFILRNDARIPISRAHKKEASERFWASLNARILRREERG